MNPLLTAVFNFLATPAGQTVATGLGAGFADLIGALLEHVHGQTNQPAAPAAK